MSTYDTGKMTDDEIRSYLGSLPWEATASGRRWSSEELHAKTDALPMKFEAANGKLLLDDAQRVQSLAALVEGLGVDVSLRVICSLIGKGERPSNWDGFLAAGRAGEDFGQELLAERADSGAVTSPASSWNYRVIQFPGDLDEAHCAIHEVYYREGLPIAYSSDPAIVMWTDEDEAGAAERVLRRFREAVQKPPLKPTDFAASDQ